ncbi:hypothetical protein E3N88_26280 [Mikania micrantha]|uniref:BED-type domain-containing protein n=1 Tax=Mikania micrantha TaxID=192012 RepID=A0A5N6N9T7_9ASTR|nr:hypothetical protein E3N88_26280 [Mikania micrantha]
MIAKHGTAQDEKKKKVRCNYCGKIVSGGIYRLKQHLARVSGKVTYCDKAPEEVCLKMKENLEGCRVGKKPKQIEYEEQTTYLNFPPCSNDNDVAEEGHHMTASAYDNRNIEKQQQQLVVGVGGDKGLVINVSPPPLRSLGYVDPGWEHGHLARIPGEVAPCKSVPEEVYLKIKENMKWHRTGRRQRRPEPHKQQPSSSSSSSAFYMVHSEDEDEEDEQEEDDPHLLITSRDKKTRFVRREEALSDVQKPETTNAQMLVANNNHKISGRKDEVISAISKFFHHAEVPAHAANSPYFHKMLEMVSQFGAPPPSSLTPSTRFLQDEILTIKTYLAEYKASWAVAGCSILADTWKDAHNRTLINIFVSCPRGVHFVSSHDATEFVENSLTLFKFLDKIVFDMGEENVVQVCHHIFF